MTTTPVISRRCALLGVGGVGAAAALAACGGGSTSSSTGAAAAAATPVSSAAGTSAAASGAGSLAAGTAIASLSDVPVGGTAAVEVVGEGVLLSQPTAGKVEAFSSVCPHQGGQVKPNGDAFKCSLHFSEFDDNGVVTKGPAAKNLTSVPVTVVGDSIMAG